jgi:hypothetical protein
MISALVTLLAAHAGVSEKPVALFIGGGAAGPLRVPPFLADFPAELLNEHNLWTAAVVAIFAGGALFALFKAKEIILREIRSSLAAEDRKPALEVKQPLVIQHADRVLNTDHLAPVTLRLEEHDRRLAQVERLFHEVVTKGEERGEVLASKIEEQGQITSEKVNAVHQRVDVLSKEVGQLGGLITAQGKLLEQINASLIRRKP